MISILLTNDYEVFGNGSGDVERDLVGPTNEVLSLCSRYGAVQTLFVDVVEYWRFREAENSGIFGKAYRAASLIEAQLREAVASGHDVQLHVHPQWLMATPVSADAWQVDNRHWRTPMVPNGLGEIGDRFSLRGLLHQGKQTLESLLKPVKQDYRCVTFRAGGYCIQPEHDVLQAMKDAGLSIDSSVCPGRHRDRPPAYFDYRSAPVDRPYWKISDCVTTSDSKGELLELPVATARQGRWAMRPRSARQFVWGIRRALFPNIVNLDYCKHRSDELISLTSDYIARMTRELGPDSTVPVVLIGHSKEWRRDCGLDGFLEWIGRMPNMQVQTVGNWLSGVSTLPGGTR